MNEGSRVKLTRTAALLCCLLGMTPTLGATATGNELFAEGVRAFKNGKYSVAVDYFGRARAQGVTAPALFYNLGVSLYKLGRYAEAENAFRTIANDPAWGPLAYYNIGLAAFQRDNRAVARDYFDRAWRTSEDLEIRALSLTMLGRLGSDAVDRTRGFIETSLGYSDNVTLTTNNQTLDSAREGDAFIDLFASATGQWRSAADALHWVAELDHTGYQDLSDDNITELLLGVGKLSTLGAWQTDTAARYEYVLAGGHSFQQAPSARLRATRDFDDDRALHLQVEVSAIDTLNEEFDHLDGYRQELELSWSHRAGIGHIEWGATLENDRRKDLETGTEFFSYSSTGYGAWIWSSWPLGAGWYVEPSLSYSVNRHADPDRRAGGRIETRVDGELEFTLRARCRLTPTWRLIAEYSFTDNHSNFEEFSYEQNIVSLGVARLF